MLSISTSLSAISSQVRRHIAKSRAGAIIQGLLKSRYTELYGLIFIALMTLAFWGTNAEGQTPLLDTWVRRYVEEKALSFDRHIPAPQLADINSLFAGTGGDSASMSPSPTMESSTVRDSAIVAMAPPDVDYMDQLGGHRSQVIEYMVQEGDLLSFIASDFGVSTNSIMWANNLKNADSISPGQTLRIPPITGLLYKAKKGDSASVLAKKYAGDEARIISYNSLPKDGSLDEGDEIVIPDGRPAAGVATAPAIASSIDNRIRKAGTYTKAGSALAALKFNYLPDLGNYFMNPSNGFNWGIIHGRNGVDEANTCGTPILAAADGTVTVADAVGWNGGFGKYIKISHPNGTETLYGHLSKVIAVVGQVVGKGQKIGLMGTTGRSTGCHVHFEVHGARNPLAKY